MATFGAAGMMPAQALARTIFRDEPARALFAGCAAHSVLPLTQVASSAPGLVLAAAAHTTGWPIAAGGAQAVTDALAAYLRSLGGTIVLNTEVSQLSDLPPADATLFDTSIATLDNLAGDTFTPGYRKVLRGFQHGPGIFKLDFALREPIPWRAAACSRAATVHLGGTLDEIALSEDAAFHGRPFDPATAKPFVLLVQPSLFDPTRAPAGKHTAWAYCHVPYGSTENLTTIVEAQIERFAPGFRECILASRASNAADLARWDPNLAGGDISGGAMTLSQLILRPTERLYATSNPHIYLCSSSTPPGGGVHGMNGHLAALAALEGTGN